MEKKEVDLMCMRIDITRNKSTIFYLLFAHNCFQCTIYILHGHIYVVELRKSSIFQFGNQFFYSAIYVPDDSYKVLVTISRSDQSKKKTPQHFFFVVS